jgi:hypothetical protein
MPRQRSKMGAEYTSYNTKPGKVIQITHYFLDDQSRLTANYSGLYSTIL